MALELTEIQKKNLKFLKSCLKILNERGYRKFRFYKEMLKIQKERGRKHNGTKF